MKYKQLLSLDPSGNFNEGKGTTGWCLFDTAELKVLDTNFLTAKQYECQEDYWDAHIQLIKQHISRANANEVGLVVEDYVLYEAKMRSQTHSRMETPKVIGVIEHFAWIHRIKCHKQLAAEVKTRWADEILEYEGIIKKKGRVYVLPDKDIKINKHCKDAIRHATHYSLFKNKE